MKEVDGILVAAHELKAPLAVLRQLALSLDGLTPSDERIKTQMVEVSERAIRQVNDLAKVRRLEDGLFVMEPVAVRAVCDDVTRELERLFLSQEKSITARYHNHARLAYANRELLYSIIYNFLINAMHYSDTNTKSLLTVGEASGHIKISVRDYGPALPTRIWQAIRQNHIDQPLSIAMRPGSSGLGLYIAAKFAHSMHAEIGAIRHNDGTSFYVSLPISKQASLWSML